MNLILREFIRLDFKKYLTSYKVFFGIIISSFITLFLYFYTSKAIGDNFHDLEMNYFSYILIAELVLLIPSYLVSFSVDQMKQWKTRGLFDYLLSVPVTMLWILTLRSLAIIPRCLFLLSVQLFIAVVIFDFNISLSFLASLFFFSLASFPLFFLMGILALSLFLLTGRGSASLGYFNTVLSLLSGAYFPLSVLPEWLSSIAVTTPYAYLLSMARKSYGQMSVDSISNELLGLFVWSVLFLFLSILLFKKSLKFYKNNPNRYSFDL